MSEEPTFEEVFDALSEYVGCCDCCSNHYDAMDLLGPCPPESCPPKINDQVDPPIPYIGHNWDDPRCRTQVDNVLRMLVEMAGHAMKREYGWV